MFRFDGWHNVYNKRNEKARHNFILQILKSKIDKKYFTNVAVYHQDRNQISLHNFKCIHIVDILTIFCCRLKSFIVVE